MAANKQPRVPTHSFIGRAVSFETNVDSRLMRLKMTEGKTYCERRQRPRQASREDVFAGRLALTAHLTQCVQHSSTVQLARPKILTAKSYKFPHVWESVTFNSVGYDEHKEKMLSLGVKRLLERCISLALNFP